MGAELTPAAVLAAYPRDLIKNKAKQLSGQRGFFCREEEDLRQELIACLLPKLNRFDPQRGDLNAFMKCVVETAAAMAARERKRLKRGGGVLPISLDQAKQAGSKEEVSMAGRLTPIDLGRRLGLVPAAPINADEVQAAVALLSPEDQAVCRELMAGTSSSAAKQLRTSRRQIHNAKVRIRKAFELAGFGDS